MAGGDVMFGRWIDPDLDPLRRAGASSRIGLQQYRPHDGSDLPRDELAARLAPATLALVNLETALCDAATPPDLERALAGGRVVLTAPGARAAELAELGVDVAIVANNHALDCGAEAFADTLAALEQHGLAAAGALTDADAANPVAHTVWRDAPVPIHLLAVSERPIPGWQRELVPRPAMILDHERLETELLAAIDAIERDEPGALILVSVHWGAELRDAPLPGQRALGLALVHAGAALVLGHHPHVVQPVELVERADGSRGAIAWSLGNLRFDMRDPATLERGVLEVELDPGPPVSVRSAEWHALSQ